MSTLREAAVAQLECWLRAELSPARFADVAPLLLAAFDLREPEERGEVCACGSQDMTGKVLTCVGGEGFHSREKCDPPPSPPEEEP